MLEHIKDKSFGVIPFTIKNSENLFLVVLHKDGHWGFPKGHQKSLETPIETAKRELYEETGITDADVYEDVQFRERYEYEENNKIFDKTVIYFLANIKDIDTAIPKNFQKEIKTIRWLNFQDGIKILTHQESQKILRQTNKEVIKIYENHRTNSEKNK